MFSFMSSGPLRRRVTVQSTTADVQGEVGSGRQGDGAAPAAWLPISPLLPMWESPHGSSGTKTGHGAPPLQGRSLAHQP